MRRAPQTPSASVTPSALLRKPAGMFRWFFACLLTLGLWLGAAAPAQADPGRPVGWALETASQELYVGKVSLRFDPSLAEEAYDLMEDIPTWWSDIEQALAHDLDLGVVEHLVQLGVDGVGGGAGVWRAQPGVRAVAPLGAGGARAAGGTDHGAREAHQDGSTVVFHGHLLEHLNPDNTFGGRWPRGGVGVDL